MGSSEQAVADSSLIVQLWLISRQKFSIQSSEKKKSDDVNLMTDDLYLFT